MGHCPTGGSLELLCRRMKRLEAVQRCAVPLVSCRIKREVDLVKPADKIDEQSSTIFLLGQSANKTLWQAWQAADPTEKMPFAKATNPLPGLAAWQWTVLSGLSWTKRGCIRIGAVTNCP